MIWADAIVLLNCGRGKELHFSSSKKRKKATVALGAATCSAGNRVANKPRDCTTECQAWP